MAYLLQMGPLLLCSKNMTGMSAMLTCQTDHGWRPHLRSSYQGAPAALPSAADGWGGVTLLPARCGGPKIPLQSA